MPEEDARVGWKIDCDPKTGLINYVEYVNMMMADAKTGVKSHENIKNKLKKICRL